MCFLCGASVKTSHSCPAYQTLWLTDRTAAAWTVKLTNLLTGNSAGAAVTVEMKQQEGPGLQRTTDRTKRGFKTPAHRYNFGLYNCFSAKHLLFCPTIIHNHEMQHMLYQTVKQAWAFKACRSPVFNLIKKSYNLLVMSM